MQEAAKTAEEVSSASNENQRPRANVEVSKKIIDYFRKEKKVVEEQLIEAKNWLLCLEAQEASYMENTKSLELEVKSHTAKVTALEGHLRTVEEILRIVEKEREDPKKDKLGDSETLERQVHPSNVKKTVADFIHSSLFKSIIRGLILVLKADCKAAGRVKKVR